MIRKSKQPRLEVSKKLLARWKEMLLHGSLEDLAGRVGCASRTINTIMRFGLCTIEMQQAITNALADMKREQAAELQRITEAQIETLKGV